MARLRPLRGEVTVPGDKSLSHRALILASLSTGPNQVRGLLESADVMATAEAVRAMGVEVARDGEGWVVTPPRRLSEPAQPLDCGNSGTTMRLLAGLVASQPFFSVLTGDPSLRARPMGRICKPLAKMGASVDGRAHGTLAPLAIRGGPLQALYHDLEVASAQVKSALLIAGLESGVAVREPARTRDHTERMLRAMGATMRTDGNGWLLCMPLERPLEPMDWTLPGDLSSAAFLMAAAAIVPDSEVTLRGVGLNPTRTGILDVMKAMGARLEVQPSTKLGGVEPVGDITVRGSQLHGIRVDGELALRALDELPIIAIMAACAEGTTEIRDAAELRLKESDRIARVAAGLRSLGIRVEEHPDGMTLEGGTMSGPAQVDATHDHRIAMAFAVARLVARGDVVVAGADQVSTSFPSFYDRLASLSQ